MLPLIVGNIKCKKFLELNGARYSGVFKKDRVNEIYENDANVTTQKLSDLCRISE